MTDRVYLDGNSLGPPGPEVRAAVVGVLDDWERLLVDGWNEAGWLDVERRVATALAPILGADPDEVTCTDSTSVDLFQVLVAAARLRSDRRVLLVEDRGFPTDGYVARSVAELLDLEVRAVAADHLADAVADDVAAVSVAHVDFHTGARVDVPGLVDAVHDVGSLLVVDCAHSAGAVTTDLGAWGVDLAVGCSYKFLNGGPGAPAWLYVARHLHDDVRPTVRGWFGHAAPFDFAPGWSSADGAARFRNGTPPILSMVAVAAALESHPFPDSRELERRSTTLTERFLDRFDDAGLDLEVLTPREPARRGAQVSLRHPQAYTIVRAMHDRGVVGDHRPPDVVRLGFSPVAVDLDDVDRAVEVLADVVTTRAYDDPRYAQRGVVP